MNNFVHDTDFQKNQDLYSLTMSASNKSLLFLLGLVLGLLAGASFFIFKMDDLMKKVNLFSSSRDTVVIQQALIEEKNNKKGIQKYIGSKDSSRKNMTSSEMLAQKYSREVPIKKIMAEADSLLKDTATQPHNTNDFFVVRKDELIGSKNYQVTILQEDGAVSSSDSLLEKISGIKNQKRSASAIKIEFWRSPINYKGYKMTKNKVVLFGVNQEDDIRLYQMEENIYLKQNSNCFRLLFSDEFKQFEKVSDPSILSKLAK